MALSGLWLYRYFVSKSVFCLHVDSERLTFKLRLNSKHKPMLSAAEMYDSSSWQYKLLLNTRKRFSNYWRQRSNYGVGWLK